MNHIAANNIISIDETSSQFTACTEQSNHPPWQLCSLIYLKPLMTSFPPRARFDCIAFHTEFGAGENRHVASMLIAFPLQ